MRNLFDYWLHIQVFRHLTSGSEHSATENGTRFSRNKESWADMWKQVGEATRSSWDVKVRLEEFGHHRKNEDDMLYEELDPGDGRLSFEVTRI